MKKIKKIVIITFIIIITSISFFEVYGNEIINKENEIKTEEKNENNNNNNNKENSEQSTNKKDDNKENNVDNNTDNSKNTVKSENTESTKNTKSKTNTTNSTKNNKNASTNTSKKNNNTKTNEIKKENKTNKENVTNNKNEIENENENEKEDYKLQKLELSYLDENNEKQIINITPEFNEDVYKYSCYIEKDIVKIEISYNEENYNDNIKIEGNENIPEGKSQILITVKNNEKYPKVYIIEVQKGERLSENLINDENMQQKQSQNRNKRVIFGGISILSVLTVFFILQAKKYSRRKHMKTRASKREKKAINRARDRKLNVMINKLKIDEEE